MRDLRTCPACRRHVRVDESTCPFCAVALIPELPSPLPVGRFTRAAVFAGALAGAAVACGGGQPKPEEPQPESKESSHHHKKGPEGEPDAAPAVMKVKVPDIEPMPYGAPPARDRLV